MRRTVKAIVYFFYLTLATIGILEVCYRYYVIDFYRPELEGINDLDKIRSTNKPVILVLGDSFAAGPEGFVTEVRREMPKYHLVNAGVPGTTISQHQLMLKKRIEEFDPEIIIYQLYVGNDVLEFRHPATGNISLIRKIYWKLSDHIRVLAFINFRMRHLRRHIFDDLATERIPQEADTFAASEYSARTRLYFRADPSHLDDTILLKGKSKNNALAYIEEVSDLLAAIPDSIPLYVLVIPHSVQVNPKYQERLTKVGGKLSAAGELMNGNYPFFEALKVQLQSGRCTLINPLPTLQERDTAATLYFANDPHLTSEGHKIIGALLVNKISNH